jgi:hypothetical protein
MWIRDDAVFPPPAKRRGGWPEPTGRREAPPDDRLRGGPGGGTCLRSRCQRGLPPHPPTPPHHSLRSRGGGESKRRHSLHRRSFQACVIVEPDDQAARRDFLASPEKARGWSAARRKCLRAFRGAAHPFRSGCSPHGAPFAAISYLGAALPEVPFGGSFRLRRQFASAACRASIVRRPNGPHLAKLPAQDS